MYYYVFLTLIGFIVGIVNYWLLKITIKIMLEKKKLYIMFVSFFLRTLGILTIFYIFLDENWKNILCLLAGFILSKILSIYLTKNKKIA
jgi:hypothetical protein